MVDVAQLVRAPVCGTGGRGFKSRHPPHIIKFQFVVLSLPLQSSLAVYAKIFTRIDAFVGPFLL